MSATKAAMQRELARRVLARRRLLQFTQATHGNYAAGWVHEDICRRLEKFSKDVADGKSPRLMLLVPPRHGKQIADEEPVFTPAGWVRHGDLRPGDFVFHPSGLPVRVIAVSEGAPQDCTVEFFDGGAVACHENHEWTVYDRSQHKWRTLETREIEASPLQPGGRARFQLPRHSAPQLPPKDLPVDPYFLGAWLGDGKASEPVICGTQQDLDQICALIPYKRGSRWVHKGTGAHYQSFVGGIRAVLRTNHLLGNKRIPKAYFTASVEQRRRLLAGLVDTDGSVEPGTQRVRFRSGSEPLAREVAALVRTLGYRASIDYIPADTRERHITGGESWCVQWTPHDGAGGGFLPRKQVHRVRSPRRIGIKAVHRNTHKEIGRCIQVDSPDGLYLVGLEFYPTHNSELASIRFPSWHLGQYPHHEIINVGYNIDLPMGFSRKVREVFRDPQFQAFFPDAQLSPDTQAVEKWTTTRGGGFTAAGVGGGITGKGAHVLIIDDPIKNQEEADSILVRDKLWDWYQSTAYTRLAPGGGVLVIETWWNDDDLAGRLQQMMLKNPEADQFEVIKFPALSEYWEYRHRVTGAIHRYPEEIDPEVIKPNDGADFYDLELLRPTDTCLHEDRYPTKELKRIRANLQPRIWSALYQQNPVPDEGMYFTKEMFHTARILPAVGPNTRLYTAWDFAISTKQQNDWTVGVTLLHDETDTLYVLDVTRFKGDSYEIVDNMLNVYETWGAQAGSGYLLGVEDGQIWRAIEPLLKRRMVERKLYPPCEIMRPLTDKLARARPLQGRMQQKRVVFPEAAQWYGTAQQEMLRFPAGAHDDIVDALAWAVRLSLGKEPPRPAAGRASKSWRDQIPLLGAVSGGHMSA